MRLGRVGSWAAGILAAGLLGAGLVAAMGRWGAPVAGGALPGRATSRESIELTAESPRGTTGGWVADDGTMAYEATVAVVTNDAEGCTEELAKADFEAALWRRMGMRPEEGLRPYRIALRPVSGSPLVLVSAQALDSDLASRLAHEAASLLVERTSGPPKAWRQQAQVLAATCSPPVMVRWDEAEGPAGSQASAAPQASAVTPQASPPTP